MGIIRLVMNFKIFGHLALLLCWELHWLSVFDSVLQPPSVYYGLSAFLCDNVFITPHPSGQMEIIPPLGPIIPPSACIIPPSGRLDLRSTASLRRDNAGLRRNNGVLRRNNFHCPSGWGVIISHYSCEKCPFCPYEDRFLSFSPNMKNARTNLWPYVSQFCSKLQLSGDSMFHEFYVGAKIN